MKGGSYTKKILEGTITEGKIKELKEKRAEKQANEEKIREQAKEIKTREQTREVKTRKQAKEAETRKQAAKKKNLYKKREQWLELTPDPVVEVVWTRIAELERIKESVEDQLLDVPEGTLRIQHRGEYKQYYHRTEPKDPIGQYMRREEFPLVLALAQKDYNGRILKELQDEIDAAEKFLKMYHPERIKAIYQKMHKVRKELITPVMFSDEEFVRKWCEVEYEHMGFKEDDAERYTEKGIRVRSKSELIIGNKLEWRNIPYRYEFPIQIGNYLFHPDFTCLNVRTRKTCIWEHFGMMDDPDYAEKTVKKIEDYAKHGYILGDNFIATFETKGKVLDTRVTDEIIEKFLK